MCFISIFVFMGIVTLDKYEAVSVLPAKAVPIKVFAQQQGYRNRSYIYVKYDRHINGFMRDDVRYYSPDPGYRIVTYHNACYVIPN